MAPATMVSVPYGLCVWASALAGVVPVAAAELEVGAAVAGREESFASVYRQNLLVSAFCS